MSLLPQTIIPPGYPIGTWKLENGQEIPVTIEKNWWLLFYNMAQNSIGSGTGLPAAALQEISTADSDAADADAIALRRPIDNLSVQQSTNADIADADAIVLRQQVSNALVLAQDALLSDVSATPGLANPTGTVGLTAVNGSAATAIRSDGAPPLSQAIAPTWTSQHIFTPGTSTTAIIVNTTANNVGISARSGAGSGALIEVCGDGSGTGNGLSIVQTSTGAGLINLNFNASLSIKVNGTVRVVIDTSGNLTVSGGLGINGNAATAQSTGWGTPVGGSVINNYNITDAGGANSNTNKVIAQLVSVLKSVGILGT